LKLHQDSTTAYNTVTAYDHDYIEVNRVRFSRAIAFGPEGAVADWPVARAAGITPALLEQAAGIAAAPRDPLAFLDQPETGPARPAHAPEVLLVGTGARQQLLPRDTLRPLLALGIGVEVMDTRAAARTYNILMAEGRRVIAALIPVHGANPA
jgi:uncharacterized protein